MRWWRCYDEELDDPKAQELPAVMFRYYHNLRHLANRGQPRGFLPEMPGIAFALRVSLPRAVAIVAFLREWRYGPMLDEVDGRLTPHGWQNRQFGSDDSTPRVSRSRDRYSNTQDTVTVTPSVTPPDTDTEADTEEIQNRSRADPRRSLSAVGLAQESQRAERQVVVSRLVDRASKRFRWRLTKTSLLAEHRFAGELLDLYPEESIAIAIDRRQKLSSIRWLGEWMQQNQAEATPPPRPAILDAPPGVAMPEEVREQMKRVADMTRELAGRKTL